MAVSDALVVILGFTISFWYVFCSGWYHDIRELPVYFIPSVVLVTIIFIITFQLEGLYKYQAITNNVHQLQSIMKCYVRVLASFILLVFFLKTEYIADSRFTIGTGFFLSFLLMVFTRGMIIPRVYYYLVTKGVLGKKALIIGAGEHGTTVCQQFQESPRSYFSIVGFCDDDFEKIGKSVCGLSILGTTYELESIISRYRVREIIIAISNVTQEALLDLIDRCKAVGITVHIISDLFTKVNEKMEAEEFGGVVTYRIVPRSSGIFQAVATRLIDFIGSAILLAVLSPLFGVIAWAVKRDSEGPVLYKSTVVGKGEKTFTAFKFRSMIDRSVPQLNTLKGNPVQRGRDYADPPAIARPVRHAGAWQACGHDRAGCADDKKASETYREGYNNHTEFMKRFIQGKTKGEFHVTDENRITKVGRILRKYSLDELPQLINVFLGEMSLVGPRFCSPEECSFYKPWHKRRFRVKPGMTGLWQVRARSEVGYDDMVMLDLYYIENKSVFLDLEILLRTVAVVVFGKGSRID